MVIYDKKHTQELASDEEAILAELLHLLEKKLPENPNPGDSKYFDTHELPGPITEGIEYALEEILTRGPWSWVSHMCIPFAGEILIFGA